MTDFFAYLTTAAGAGLIGFMLKWLLDAFRAPADVKKARAEADNTAVGTALTLVRELRVEIDRTKEQVVTLTEEVERLRFLIGALESEIVALGGDPARIFKKFDP